MDQNIVRKQLLELLQGGNAHMPFEQAVERFPIESINQYPPNVEYTPWQLLEHIRLSQKDILEFIRDPHYSSPPWPEGYWPAAQETANASGWKETLRGLQKDRQALIDLVTDTSTDLLSPLAHAPNYTVLREILVVSDHTAYHLGEFAALRQVMGTWPKA